MILSKENSWSDLFVRGGVLWRPVSFRFTAPDFIEARIDDFSDPHSIFTQSDNGRDWAAKISFSGNFCYEPEVFPESIPHIVNGKPIRISGFVVIVPRMPSRDWTHLIITGVSTKMRDKGLPTSSGVVFAEPAEPYDMADYLLFRGSLAKTFIQNPIGESAAQFNKCTDLMSDILPKEPRVGTYRIFCSGLGKREKIFYNTVEEVEEGEYDSDPDQDSESGSVISGEEVLS